LPYSWVDSAEGQEASAVRGAPIAAVSRRLTTEEFIEKDEVSTAIFTINSRTSNLRAHDNGRKSIAPVHGFRFKPNEPPIISEEVDVRDLPASLAASSGRAGAEALRRWV